MSALEKHALGSVLRSLGLDAPEDKVADTERPSEPARAEDGPSEPARDGPPPVLAPELNAEERERAAFANIPEEHIAQLRAEQAFVKRLFGAKE